MSKVSCDFAFSGHCLVLRAVNRRKFVITEFVDKNTILDQDHSQKDAFFKASSNSGVFQKHKYNKTQFQRSGLFKLAVYCKKTKVIPTESFPVVTDIVLTGGMGCVQKLTKKKPSDKF